MQGLTFGSNYHGCVDMFLVEMVLWGPSGVLHTIPLSVSILGVSC